MMLDFLTTGNAIVGFILGSFGVISGVIYWFHRRMKTVAKDVASETDGDRLATSSRLTEIETDVDGVSRDVGRVREELHTLSSRVASVERTMETVARQSDVAVIGRDLAELRGAMTSQMTVMYGQLDTLYKAALRSSPKPDIE